MHLTRHLAALLTLILCACFCAHTVQAQTATTYTDSFSGGIIRSKTERKIVLTGKAGEALPGYVTLTVSFSEVTGAVEGGAWTLTVTRQNGDKSFNETGRLGGTLSGGVVAFDQQGAVASIDNLQLSIKSGTGTYASVVSGQGAFTGAAQNIENAPPFTGTLSFTF